MSTTQLFTQWEIHFKPMHIHFQIWIFLLSTAQFYVRSVYTSSATWQPAPFCPLRVASLFSCGRTRRFRRVNLVASRSLWGTYYYMTCRAGTGQTPSASFTQQAESNRIDSPWGRGWDLRYEMEAFQLHDEPSRAESKRTELDREFSLADVSPLVVVLRHS